LTLHNDYGGPTATKETETESHRQKRLKQSAKYGMNNTRDLYSIAMNCYSCHMVPNEDLVNIGGHTAGTKEFELVRYSQGQVRHNFLRSDGETNEPASQNRLRMMYVVGLIADLEKQNLTPITMTNSMRLQTKFSVPDVNLQWSTTAVRWHSWISSCRPRANTSDREQRLNTKRNIVQ
jgi:hypothetical protein